MAFNIENDFDQSAQELLSNCNSLAYELRHEFVTPEHMLHALMMVSQFRSALRTCITDLSFISQELKEYFNSLDKVEPSADEYFQFPPEFSIQYCEMLDSAVAHANAAGKDKAEIPHIVKALVELPESMAAFLLNQAIDRNPGGFFKHLIELYQGPDLYAEANAKFVNTEPWRKLVVCINDHLKGRNPLVGRQRELERTMQILCRKDKNNPLYIGEPGVGKTALVYGLARMINDSRVPNSLRGQRIYSLDIGSLLSDTKYRGDMESRIKTIMNGISSEPGAIVYIDEIHNLVGAGEMASGSMDASNMLKPYLEAGNIRFIGSTTYEEYKRYFAKSKGIVRRFQQIDVVEPTVDETIEILRQLKPGYETFHGVTYPDETLVFAAQAAARHITDRFLPDKAIDLIDEAGAYRQLHPLAEEKVQTVDVELVADILSKICRVDSLAIKAEVTDGLEDLEERIKAKIYGQDAAVRAVTEAVQMAKAGLTEEGKPLASLLFVGPTGVGKTEVARVLAQELGIELLRFDMSEYTEKHTVAKLIGAPAGYVGYDDGGLLTDAIRRTPNCVLLLDEIEKAHEDIYNILLQVMDYARLTDNRGNHADFRNVILIMTSNAGAQFASQASVGFGSRVTAGDAMLSQVKKTFKPEFINRLSGTVVFRDMDRSMAGMILDKKLRQLRQQLEAKNVSLELSDAATELILNEGFTREYGARELDRVIGRRLKPLLMRNILFGSLRQGGTAQVDVQEGNLVIK